MVSDHERIQLLTEYRREPESVVRLLLTCAAGLLVVFLLAWVGYDIHTFDAATEGAASSATLGRPAL